MPSLDMFVNPSMVHRLRIICYAVLVFFSFFIFIGVAVMKDKFDGNCPLYAPSYTAGNCDFPMAIAILFQLLFLSFRIASLLLLLLGKFTTDFVLFSDMFQLVYLAVDIVGCFFTFIGACILSAGTNSTCSWLEKNRNVQCDRIVDAQDFYSPSKAAQAGAWISTFVWGFIAAVGFFYMWRNGKIPFLGGGSPSASSGAGAQDIDGTSPPIETPPPYQEPSYHPDDLSKY